MRSIALLLDVDTTRYGLLELGAALAVRHVARLHLVEAREPGDAGRTETLLALVRNRVHQESVARRGVWTQPLIRSEGTIREAVELATEGRPDLLVASASGRTAVDLVRSSTCPVILVGDTVPERPPGRPFFGRAGVIADGSSASVQALHLIAALAAREDAGVAAIRIVSAGAGEHVRLVEEAHAEVDRLIDGVPVGRGLALAAVRTGEAAAVLKDLVSEKDYDFFGLGCMNDEALRMAVSLAKAAAVPLLCVRHGAPEVCAQWIVRHEASVH